MNWMELAEDRGRIGPQSLLGDYKFWEEVMIVPRNTPKWMKLIQCLIY
jgi:hypothetical protein